MERHEVNMKKRIFNNWVLKLSSVAIAVVLWVVVYNINDPVDTSTIRNVPVTFINTEAIKDNINFAYIL